MSSDALARNLRLYPWYYAAWNALFWTPVFFLYFGSLLPPAQVLQLEACYYLSVVVLEVPSGYASDRWGRRVTLLVACGAWVAAGVAFTLATGFVSLLVGQVLLALGMAFTSGTDSSLLYETLAASGRAAEASQREARAQMAGFVAAAGAAVGGGALALLGLRWVYAASAVSAVVALAIAWRFVEPPVGDRAAHRPVAQFVACVARLRDPTVAWLITFAVGMVVFEHVPYQLVQPWLDLWAGATWDTGALALPLAGAALAVAALLAAVASTRVAAVERRLGVPATLCIVLAVQAAVIAVLGWWLHPALLAVIAIRMVPRALGRPVERAALHHRLPHGIRATFLSLQSLAGRLAFSVSLWIAAWAVESTDALTFPALGRLTNGYAAVAVGVLAVLACTAPWLRWQVRLTSE